MVYPYFCKMCDYEFDVVKHHSKSSKKEKCPACKRVAARIWPMPTFTGTSIENAEYNPGLGAVTKSKRDRDEKAKRMGLVEIGNEKSQTLRKEFSDYRAKKRKQAYED